MRSQSHPVWGAWIETLQLLYTPMYLWSHPVWGAWIETISLCIVSLATFGRTPCGVRGLKHILRRTNIIHIVSHPVWGAWIET